MRWLANFLLVLLAGLLCFAGLLFLLGNSEPVSLELLVTARQPRAPLGQWLLLFLLVGLVLGLLTGLLVGASVRKRHRPPRA